MNKGTRGFTPLGHDYNPQNIQLNPGLDAGHMAIVIFFLLVMVKISSRKQMKGTHKAEGN